MKLLLKLLEMLPYMVFNICFFILLLLIIQELRKLRKDICKLNEEVHSMAIARKIYQLKKLEKQNERMKYKFRPKDSALKQEDTARNQPQVDNKQRRRGKMDSYNILIDDK